MISFNQSQIPLEAFNVKHHFIGLASHHHEVCLGAKKLDSTKANTMALGSTGDTVKFNT